MSIEPPIASQPEPPVVPPVASIHERHVSLRLIVNSDGAGRVDLRLTNPATVIDGPTVLEEYDAAIALPDLDDFVNQVYKRLVEIVEQFA